MKITKYAAIDIGSNALRLLISSVIEYKNETIILKNSLVRVPIRLGEDAFTTGIISRNNIKQINRSMKAFQNLMKVHNVDNYLAFATAALREAENGKYVVDRVKKKLFLRRTPVNPNNFDIEKTKQKTNEDSIK